MTNEMIPWIALPIIGLLLAVLFAYLFFSNRNARTISAQQQIRALQRSVQEKNAEIELLYQTIRKRAIDQEAFHRKIEFLQKTLEQRTFKRNSFKAPTYSR
jgi:hypothetical protein